MSKQNQQVNLKIKGLYTAPNDFSGCPDGSLDVADNVVIDYENLSECRRGFTFQSGDLPLSSDRVYQFTTYQGYQIVSYGDVTPLHLAYYTGSAYTTYSGTYESPDTALSRVRFMEANQNLYITTSVGVKKLDVYSGTPAAAGVPRGLDLQLSLSASAGGFMSTNTVATVTATTASGSPNLTKVSSVSAIVAGQYIYGTGITSGTTVSSVGTSDIVLSTTATSTAGNTVIVVTVATGLAAGQLVVGSGIPTGARIATGGISGSNITLTQAATATNATAAAVTFYSDPVVVMSANASASGTVSLVFSDGAQVGYRGLFGIRDANNNLIYGAPTQFASITNNTGVVTNVSVTATIPSGITTSHFFQLYRSPQTASASIVPLDDEQLVYEANPTSGEISAGYMTVVDSTPDSLRGLALYTSTSQEGIAQANTPPPYCKDFCTFKGFSIYANVKSKQNKKITILATGGSNGIAVDDTITIGGITFTAKSSETIASGYYKVYNSVTDPTGTPAQQIADTANSLIRVINRYTSNTVTVAILLSGPTDLPGQILLEEKGTGASSFAITASAHGSAYSPSLPTSGTTVSSAQDIYKNGLMISKSGQPEAVPTENILFAGSASEEVLRVIPLREYVVVLKQDGIFRMTGTSLSNLDVQPFDLTTKLISPESARQLSNEVWGFFDQGVCSISDTGVNVRSRPIETDLRALIGTALATIKTVAFGVGYETDRKYILALPEAEGDETCRQQYVFNTFTNAWVRWTRDATSGYVNKADDRLYFGNGDSETVSKERKTNTYADFVDEAFDVTIVSFADLDVVLSSITGIEVGDILYQSSALASVVTDITIATNTVTVQDELTWTVGAASILTAIDNVIQWKPVVAGNPSYQRQYAEGAAIFKRTRFNEATMSIYTDVSQSFADTTLEGFAIARWGTFPWGTEPWGGINRPRSVRFLVPRQKQNCAQLTPQLNIRNGYSNWALEGLSLSFNLISQEISE